MFVASLAFWSTWYLYLLGRSAAAGVDASALAFDAALFTVFAAHHSVLAREPVKSALGFIPAHLTRSVYVWTASVLLVIVCLAWRPIGGDVYRIAGAGAIALAIVQIAGAWLIARSVARIDALELAGIRPARGVDGPGGRAPRDEKVLQTSGPYRLVRHPLYLGWMLLVFGAAHMTADRLAFAAISSFYLVIAVPWEEQSLRQSFGESYARYQRTVRWRVIPYVY
jgi:protein-S-isoprenylcysteine O-methyltransferase Ste14